MSTAGLPLTRAQQDHSYKRFWCRSDPLVPPYDHPNITLGQGTLALKLQEQAVELGIPLDAIVAPCVCVGGGMLSGVAVACQGTGTRVYDAEPWGRWCSTGSQSWGKDRSGESLVVADGLWTPLGAMD